MVEALRCAGHPCSALSPRDDGRAQLAQRAARPRYLPSAFGVASRSSRLVDCRQPGA